MNKLILFCLLLISLNANSQKTNLLEKEDIYFNIFYSLDSTGGLDYEKLVRGYRLVKDSLHIKLHIRNVMPYWHSIKIKDKFFILIDNTEMLYITTEDGMKVCFMHNKDKRKLDFILENNTVNKLTHIGKF